MESSNCWILGIIYSSLYLINGVVCEEEKCKKITRANIRILEIQLIFESSEQDLYMFICQVVNEIN